MPIKFYIPVVYAFRTRMGNSVEGFVKWLCEYLIPTFFCYFLAGNSLNLAIDNYFLIILLTYTLYETGYIQNDTETIKKEKDPTLRLSLSEIAYYEKNRKAVIGIRLFIAILLSTLLMINCSFSIGSVVAVTGSWAILLVYLIYNSVRGHMSFVLHFFLLLLRYSTATLMFIPNVSWIVFVLCITIFPLPMLMEILRKGKFGIHYNFTKIYLNDYEKRHIFRIKYYFLLTMFFSMFVLCAHLSVVICILPLFFLMYDSIFIIIKKNRNT